MRIAGPTELADRVVDIMPFVRGEEAPWPTSVEEYGLSSAIAAGVADGDAEETAPGAIPAAPMITPAAWPNQPPGPVDFLADQRVPRGDVTILAGDGGTGKTDIAVQLAAASARGAAYWLGQQIQSGEVVFISAEEPEREIRRRIWRHAERDGYAASSLDRLHLWFPDDAGAILAQPNRSGVMLATPLLRSIEAAIAAAAPVLVVVDNIAATFGGNQNDRVMARTYVNLWRAIAAGPSKPAVLLLDHPSLSGLTSGSGRGGNMDWRNATRSTLYLRIPEDRAEADRGIRILETVKSNYAPSGKDTQIRLEWRDGGLAVESSGGSLHRLAKDAECEDVFLRLLDEINGQGREVSDRPSSLYAPKVFSGMEGSEGFTRQAFAKAMDRLFADDRIASREEGPPSRRRHRLIRGAPRSGATG